MGVFGNANIGVTEFRTQSDSFRNALFDELGRPLLDAATFGLLESFNDPNEISNVENPKMANFKQLKITYQELKSKISESSKNLKEAYEECRKEKVTFTNLEKDSISYNGAQESIKLADISQEVKNLIQSDPNGKDFNFGESSAGMTLSGFAGSVATPVTMTIEHQVV